VTVFIDAGIFVALRNAEDNYHYRTKGLIRDGLNGKLGRMYTSDYIVDEAVTAAMARTRRHDVAVDVGAYILESPRFIKLAVDQEIFNLAWKKFKILEDKSLSFTDCTSLALAEKHGIKQIMSFDCGFDGLIQRIC